MDEPAAFRGYIVDGPKNVGTHKEVMLTVRFPAELGKALVSALPWPTRVNPVHVAIALLENHGEPGPTEPPKSEVKLKPKWEDMPCWKQAAILCKEPSFREYVLYELGFDELVEPEVFVRRKCGVTSRREIDGNKEAYRAWKNIMGNFCAWHDAKGFSKFC
jgi:hypothetical protein